MHKKTFVICGESDTAPDFAAIGNNPNFVFQNDPDFETVRLFDQSGNIVNVNSWLECANYVNGGWTDNISDFFNGEMYIFLVTLLATSIFLLYKKIRYSN